MPSLSDDVAAQLVNKFPDAAGKAVKTGKKTAQGTMKGIVLTFKGGKFTLELVIKAIKKLLDINSTGVNYSSKNISMEKLQKEGTVTAINDKVSKEVMKPLDKLCRKYGIKYNALYDAENDKYHVFFNAKNTEVINVFFNKATAEYFTNQAKKEKVNENGKEASEHSRSSVRGKITFFRNRAKKYNENREKMKGKHREEKSI